MASPSRPLSKQGLAVRPAHSSEDVVRKHKRAKGQAVIKMAQQQTQSAEKRSRHATPLLKKSHLLSKQACAGEIETGLKSRMKREFHIRFCEDVGVKFPRVTRLAVVVVPFS